MNNHIDIRFQRRQTQKGVSVLELILVLAIISLLAGIAAPSFTGWRESLNTRGSARNISMQLRDARSKAIAQNIQYGLEVDTANRRYRLRQGNLGYNSTWTNVALTPQVRDWISLPDGISLSTANLTPGLAGIAFHPNGTSTMGAAAGTITILDKSGNPKFQISVTQFGKISIN